MNFGLASLLKGAGSRMACVLQRREDLIFQVPGHLSQSGCSQGHLSMPPPSQGAPPCSLPRVRRPVSEAASLQPWASWRDSVPVR